MNKDRTPYKILVIEDNIGDYILVEEYLQEYIMSPKILRAHSFQDAKTHLSKQDHNFDVILLDLTLPDREGQSLIQVINQIVEETPIIVLTGYTDMSFAVNSLALGIADYILKDDMNAVMLYKSIIYNIERKKSIVKLKESEKRYSDLFQLSPLPMWVYDLETYAFLDVNRSAVSHYGYTREEFLNMTLYDIRLVEDIPFMEEAISLSKDREEFYFQGVFRHKKKDGSLIQVNLSSNILAFKGRKAEIVLINDITDRIIYTQKVEQQNQRLKEIAWIQSHVVRAPLARLMGLVNLITEDIVEKGELNNVLKNVLDSANELDLIIRDIVTKTENIKL